MNQKAHRISPAAVLTNGYIVLLFTVFLLWTGPAGYSAIQQTKNDLFRWITAGYLGLLIILGLELLLIGQGRRMRLSERLRSLSWTQRMVLLYAGLTVLSTLLSDYRQQAVFGMSRGEGMVNILLYCGAFLGISSFVKPGKWMIWVLAASMTVMNVICLLQFAGMNPFGIYPALADGRWYRSRSYLGTVGNVDLTAAILAMALPLLLGLVWQEKGWRRWIGLIAALLDLAVLLYARVQAGILGAGLSLLLAVPAAVGKGKRRTIAWLTVSAILLAGLAAVYFWPGEQGSLYEMSQLMRGHFEPTFGNGRIRIWGEVLRKTPEHLWFGTGPDTMVAYQMFYGSGYSQKADAVVRYVIDDAHNGYLNILFHQGIFALCVYLGALAGSFVKWLRTDDPITVILGTALLCYGIVSFFTIGAATVAGLFWGVWAIFEKRSEYIGRMEKTS